MGVSEKRKVFGCTSENTRLKVQGLFAYTIRRIEEFCIPGHQRKLTSDHQICHLQSFCLSHRK